MPLSEGIVVGVIGRYASEAAPPFPPRVEAIGLILPDRIHAAAIQALEAAWESTNPWATREELRRKAESWLGKVLENAHLSGVEVQVLVVDGIPFRSRD